MDDSVKLTPLGDATSTDWKVTHGWSSGSKPSDYPQVKLSKDSGAHVITFDIKGDNTVTFSSDPLWVQAGSKPNQKPPAGADNGQIGAWKVLNNGKQLVVVDWNDASGQLYYHLNVDNHGALDPIIDNGGGVKPPRASYFSDFAALALVAVAFFFAGMLVHKIFFSRTP